MFLFSLDTHISYITQIQQRTSGFHPWPHLWSKSDASFKLEYLNSPRCLSYQLYYHKASTLSRFFSKWFPKNDPKASLVPHSKSDQQGWQ